MNCTECERLFDAYLDAQLSGSLRLEFDAHRLRCTRCQQTLAMLETVGHVIASDREIPALREDFSDRVIRAAAARQRQAPLRRMLWRLGIGLQAAAAVLFAAWFGPGLFRTAPPTVGIGPSAHGVESVSLTSEQRAIRELIVDRVEERIWEMHTAGRSLTGEIVDLGRYLNILLPADVARDSVDLAGTNPWQGIWNVLLPPPKSEEPAPAPVPPAEQVHSI